MPRLVSGQYLPPLTPELITKWFHQIKEENRVKELQDKIRASQRERLLRDPEALDAAAVHALLHPSTRAKKLRVVKNVTPKMHRDR